MRLTNRDVEIINSCNIGMTINHVADLYFNGSYFTAAQRLLKLEKANLLKSFTQPTIGKKTYYTKKKPSYHRLIVNDIKVALRGKYSYVETEYKLGKTRVDCAMVLHTKKVLIFEIDIFNQTSQTKIDYINRLMVGNDAQADIWLVVPPGNKKKIKGGKTVESDKIKGLSTIY